MALPTRQDRLLNFAALAVLVLSIALYADGVARLQQIQRFSYHNPGPAGVSQLDMADQARYEANTGIVLALVSCAAGALHAIRVKRRLPLSGVI
jgi:hypothetical protein